MICRPSQTVFDCNNQYVALMGWWDLNSNQKALWTVRTPYQYNLEISSNTETASTLTTVLCMNEVNTSNVYLGFFTHDTTSLAETAEAWNELEGSNHLWPDIVDNRYGAVTYTITSIIAVLLVERTGGEVHIEVFFANGSNIAKYEIYGHSNVEFGLYYFQVNIDTTGQWKFVFDIKEIGV